MTALAAIAFVGVGCQKVTVLDQDAKPVAFAAVQVTQKGVEDGTLPQYTDFLGNAILMENLSDPEAKEMIIVSKSGYETRKVMRQKGDMSITVKSTAVPSTTTSSKSTTTASPAAANPSSGTAE